MTINCAGSPEPVSNRPTNTQPAEWTPNERTTLEQLAAQRKLALEAQASMYRSVDPLVAKQQTLAVRAQEYWEAMVFDAGRRATLDPRKSRNVEIWLANWLGVKSFTLGNGLVREPLLNMKRMADGMLREAGVYMLHAKSRQLTESLSLIAKARGIEVKPDDLRRMLEEGMTPQRLAVYGNTEIQQATLMTRYALWESDMLKRGFTKGDISTLLNQAQDVSKQFDEIQAVSMATGMNVGDLSNVGYFPRQFSADGFRSARMAGVFDKAVDFSSAESINAAMSKSRATWQYLPEDHAIAAKLMGITADELHSLIANPVDFAVFLSKKFAKNSEDLDLLVDSGIMSKVPMLTSHVEEYLSKVYQIPGVPSGMFIADPLEASMQLVAKLKAGAERSAIARLAGSEGVQYGWSVPKELHAIDPTQFPGWKPLNEVPGYQNVAGASSFMVHPDVANQASAILKLSTSPGQIAGFAAAYTAFTNWFAKQALGNPITAKSYLFTQFAGNMLGAMGRGAQPHEYMASFIDVFRVAAYGLESLDNVKPFRYIDGKAVTHREVVARTLRMFSRDILPGFDVGVLNFKALSPAYTVRQMQAIAAQANTTGGYAKEVAKLLAGKADSIFTPTLKVAQMMDLAGQLAIVRGRAPLTAEASLRGTIDAAGQFLTTGTLGKLSRWDDLVVEVKRGMPQFDDLGKIPSVVSRVVPFSSWAMANLPLQLKSMLREPSRWHNYARAHSMWNQSQLEANERAGGSNPTVGEMQAWERDQYGLISFIDPATRQVHMMFSAQFDPRWGAMASLFSATRDRSADPEVLRGDAKGNNATRALEKFIGTTYFGDIYEAISGVNTLNGVRRDDSSFSSTQFANIPMPPLLAGVLGVSPVLQSLNRLEAISGTRAVLDGRTGAVVREATVGWLGNKGTVRPEQVEGVEATLQFLGGKVRVIDGIANMQLTESDTKRTMLELTGKAFTEQKRLATEIQQGVVKRNSPEYQRRVETINRMYDTALQMNLDLARIEAWAVANRVPSRDMLRQKQERQLTMEQMPLPGADHVQKLLQQGFDFKRGNP